MSFRLREFDAPDFTIIRNILSDVWNQCYSQYEIIDSLNKLLGDKSLTFLLPKAGERTVLAFVDEQPIGVLVTRRTHGINHIQGLYIIPRFQRQGIGKMLVSHIADQSLAGTIFEVEVIEANKNAVAFYTALGFLEVGRHHIQIKEGFALTTLLMNWNKV